MDSRKHQRGQDQNAASESSCRLLREALTWSWTQGWLDSGKAESWGVSGRRARSAPSEAFSTPFMAGTTLPTVELLSGQELIKNPGRLPTPSPFTED